MPMEMDRFMCCGQQYKAIKNGVFQVLLESNTDVLKAELQVNKIQKHKHHSFYIS